MDEGIVLMVALLLDHLPALATLSPDIDEGSLGAHDARGTIGIIAETGGIAHQEAFRILQQRMERIRIFSAVVPGVNAAHRHYRGGERIFEKIVDQVDAMA